MGFRTSTKITRMKHIVWPRVSGSCSRFFSTSMDRMCQRQERNQSHLLRCLAKIIVWSVCKVYMYIRRSWRVINRFILRNFYDVMRGPTKRNSHEGYSTEYCRCWHHDHKCLPVSPYVSRPHRQQHTGHPRYSTNTHNGGTLVRGHYFYTYKFRWYWNAFSWMRMFEFRLIFHWSMFLKVKLAIFQHWFRYGLAPIRRQIIIWTNDV